MPHNVHGAALATMPSRVGLATPSHFPLGVHLARHLV